MGIPGSLADSDVDVTEPNNKKVSALPFRHDHLICASPCNFRDILLMRGGAVKMHKRFLATGVLGR